MRNVALRNAEQVVQADLEHLTQALSDEWKLLAGRRLLVTGGAGFLGYYFTRAIVHHNRHARAEERVALTVYDNLVRGAPAWLAELDRGGELELVTHDMRQPLPARFGPFDYVIHAASIASPTYYRAHPVETMDANIVGLRNLLDYGRAAAATADPLLGLLFLSSSEIYGDPDPKHIPTAETYRGFVSCTGPRACYDEAKRFGETLCTVFAHHHDVPTRIARPFNNYGPGLKINDGRVLPDFARDVLTGRDLVVLSDGKATRTFCYTADAVAGYYKVLLRGRAGEAYNIGTETPEISVRQLAEQVVASARELFGYRGQIVYRASEDPSYVVDNPTRRCPDITKARQEVGYVPSISFEQGLERSLLWYRDNLDGVHEGWASTTPRRTGAAA